MCSGTVTPVKKQDFTICTFTLGVLLLFRSTPSQSISIHPLRLAVMTVLSSAITAGVNGIPMLTLETDYHIV